MNWMIVSSLLLTTAAAAPLSKGNDEGSRQRRSDDISLTSLADVVQQQAAQIQTLTAELTALKNTLPSTFQPVSFTARFSGDNIPIASSSILQFDKVVTNIGNGYNPQTGIFTAPVAGLYGFFLTVMSVNGRHDVSLFMDKHGEHLDLVYAEGGSDTNDQGSGLVTTHLAAGEQLWVRQNTGDSVRGSWWTIFTGYLLQAD